MRSWSIHRKFLAITLLAVVLFTGLSLGILESGRHYQNAIRTAVGAEAATTRTLDEADRSLRSDQIWLIVALGAAILISLAAAWRSADALAKRIARARERDTQVQRSSEFLEFAQAAGGFGVFDLDLVTSRVSGTPLFFELLDIRSNEALVTWGEWLATVHPEDAEGLRHSLNAAIDTGGTFQTEYRSLLLDSSTR